MRSNESTHKKALKSPTQLHRTAKSPKPVLSPCKKTKATQRLSAFVCRSSKVGKEWGSGARRPTKAKQRGKAVENSKALDR